MRNNLGNVCTVINGRAYKQSELLEKGKYKVLRVGNFFTNSSWYYSDLELEENKYCDYGDLLFAWSASFGPRIWKGNKTIYHYHIWKMVVNSKVLNKMYLFYYLQDKTHSFLSSTHGTTMLHLTKAFMEELEVFYPKNLDTQKNIAKVLSDLDAKIELNNRINAELEAMAKLLYDYWFVQFEFSTSTEQAATMGKPELKGHPYKSSGGTMVYNEELKREIPEGWEVGSLNDIGSIIGGSTPSKAIDENFCRKIGTPWITPKDLSNNKGNKYITRGDFDVTDKGIKNASLKLMPKGTVLLSSRAPIGYLAISQEEVTTNQGFKSFVPDKGYSTEFIYYTVRNMIPAIENNAVGSTFKEVSGTTLKSIKTSLPNKAVIKLYNAKAECIFKRQSLLEIENQQLATLRDWLLPLLMNGQVTVGVAEEKLNMAAEPSGDYKIKGNG